MTTKEVAEYLRFHKITVWKYAAEGKLPAVRIGRFWRFDKDKIDEWIAKFSMMRKERKKSSNGGKKIREKQTT